MFGRYIPGEFFDGGLATSAAEGWLEGNFIALLVKPAQASTRRTGESLAPILGAEVGRSHFTATSLWSKMLGAIDYRMANKKAKSKRRSMPDVLLSLFDADNLETLDHIRRKIASAFTPDRAPAPRAQGAGATGAPAAVVDRLFEQCAIDESQRKVWQAGNLDIEIIHRGWVRISKDDWPPLIDYCKRDCRDGNISKQFRLHVLADATLLTWLVERARTRPWSDAQELALAGSI